MLIAKNVLVLAAVITGLLIATTGSAYAHVFREDNGTTVELHIPPDDKPQPGVSTKLQLEFETGFPASDCDCSVMVQRNSKTVQQVKAAVDTNSEEATMNAFVKFPKKGTYKLVVTGKSKDSGFKEFQVSYPVVVGQTTATTQAKSWSIGDAVLIAGTVLVVLGLVGYNVLRSRRRLA